jgi:predicted ribonuclease YlaK
MSVLVADTSGLVSLGIDATDGEPLLDRCLDAYDVHVPTVVIDELEEIADHDDRHGASAQRVLDRRHEFTVRDVALDPEFPLDDGENAGVALANDMAAALFLSDECNQLGLVHASLANTRLVTTPTLLAVLVRNDRLTRKHGRALLDEIGDARSWSGNAYVERARSLLEDRA